LGYGLFIAILAGLVIYQIATINRLQAVNKALNDISLKSAMLALNAKADLEGIIDFTKSIFETSRLGSDPSDYKRQLAEFQKSYDDNLKDLSRIAATEEDQDSIKRLVKSWESVAPELDVLREGQLSEEMIANPLNLPNKLNLLRGQTDDFLRFTSESVKTRVDNSQKSSKTAVKVLYSTTALALAISILVSFLIYRSISKPLASLTEGTRAIAEGKFFYRLDTSRNDEFSQLAKDFNTMTHRLNDLDELKKDFVSHVSHELKAPLASMRETIQLLLEEIPGPLTEKQKRLLQLNLQSELRLTSMISNLLDLSKTEAGVMEYELKRRDLIPLVRNAIAELDVQAQERKIRIEAAFPNAPLPVECDSDRIIQVLVNLIGNAVNFSSRGGTVQVKVEAVEGIPGNVPESWRRLITGAEDGKPFGLVTITDTGPGILDSDKEKIFEKFHQIKRGKKVVGQGVGLGLAICRTIVQAHRGAIWAEDNPGGGSRFHMLLRPGQEGEEVIPRASVPI
jgi:signal transduction histidine kinase